MAIDLSSIFNDEDFDDLTKQPEKKVVEKQDPEIQKFQEIIDFVSENNREPQKTSQWTVERSLWARLEGFRNKADRKVKVIAYDSLGLLDGDFENEFMSGLQTEVTDYDDLESALEDDDLIGDFSGLLDVSRYKRTVHAADKIGRRKRAKGFEQYKTLFEQVHADIASGKRRIIPFEQYDIEEGRFYIQNGVMLYVIEISKDTFMSHGKLNARMHVVYENGTENKELLLQSLAASLYSTERHGRMVTDIIDDETLAESLGAEFTTGFIYVLQSLSQDPAVNGLKNLYKIGFTRNSIESRISNAEGEATYLNAPVRLMLSVEVKNINAQLLERTLHHAFADKQVLFDTAEFKAATEWYMVPLEEIENKINEVIADVVSV